MEKILIKLKECHLFFEKEMNDRDLRIAEVADLLQSALWIAYDIRDYPDEGDTAEELSTPPNEGI